MKIADTKCKECGGAAEVHKDKVKYYVKCNSDECGAMHLYQTKAARARLLASLESALPVSKPDTEEPPAANLEPAPPVSKPDTKPAARKSVKTEQKPKSEPKKTGGFLSSLF